MTAVPTDARFTPEQRAALERIEAADAAPESFDPIAEMATATELLRRLVMDYGDGCDPWKDPCSCSIDTARRYLTALGVQS